MYQTWQSGGAWGKDRFVAVSTLEDEYSYVYINDRKRWTSSRTPFIDPADVAWGKGQFIVAGKEGKVLTSPDGIN